MPTAFFIAALTLGQCPGGVCPAPSARYAVARPSVAVYAAPQATYQATACKPVKRGLLGIFRRGGCR